jgi:serine protease Do
MRRFVSFVPALVVLFAAVAALLVVPSVVYRVSAARTAAELTLVRQAVDDDDILERLNRAIRNVAQSVTPSVVHVEVIENVGSVRSPRGSSGAAWVYDDSGHVITNAHVVEDASEIWLQFHDGRRARAKLVGTDAYTDVAVLEVTSGVPVFPARRATGQDLEVGDRVFAFGSPFGFKFSMSEGIVSGLGREARASRTYGFSNYIQTDAAVNPGNSGGPLVDIRGRVVGMNVAIATARSTQGSTEGQSAGISFAIPLATVESVVSQLVGTGTVERGYLGISFRFGGEEEIYDPNGTYQGTGVRVDGVERGPARDAGLRTGDIIVSIDARPTLSTETLRSLVSTSRPGDSVNVRFWRKDRFEERPVKLGVMPVTALSSRTEPGVYLRPTPQGLQVAAVDEDASGRRAGFAVGQYVLEVDGAPVEDFSDFTSKLADSGFRQGNTVSVKVREGTAPDVVEKVLKLKLDKQ